VMTGVPSHLVEAGAPCTALRFNHPKQRCVADGHNAEMQDTRLAGSQRQI
jgi:hypothetical protein